MPSNPIEMHLVGLCCLDNFERTECLSLYIEPFLDISSQPCVAVVDSLLTGLALMDFHAAAW